MNWAKMIVGAVVGGVAGTIVEGIKIGVSNLVPERWRKWFIIGGDAALAGVMLYNAMRTDDEFWMGVSVGIATAASLAFFIESRELWRRIAILSGLS